MHKVQICGIDTKCLPKLTREESDALLAAIKKGDTAARDRFVMANLRLVLSVVQRFSDRNCSDDLFQVGVVGLLKAVDGFDPKYNVRFSTYAVPMIMGEIRRYVKEGSGIKVSRSLRDTAYKALHAKELLEKKLSRSPALMEIAAEIDLPVREVADALDAVSETVSMQESVYNDGDDSVSLMDQIGDDRQSEEVWADKICLNGALCELPEKEKQVLIMRYYVGKTQMEISEKIGISQAQVSRLEKNAVEKLRKMIG